MRPARPHTESPQSVGRFAHRSGVATVLFGGTIVDPPIRAERLRASGRERYTEAAGRRPSPYPIPPTGYNHDVRPQTSGRPYPMLIILGGLPGVGKTTIAVALARLIGAQHLRIDSIEQAIRASGVVSRALNDAGYRVAYAVAEDNLRIGRTVIADSVNPLHLTREAWLSVANRAGVRAIEIEVKCSDVNEHRRRVETRTTDVPGLKLPTWEDVVGRDYHPWDREHLVIDTAGRTIEQCVNAIRLVLPEQ